MRYEEAVTLLPGTEVRLRARDATFWGTVVRVRHDEASKTVSVDFRGDRGVVENVPHTDFHPLSATAFDGSYAPTKDRKGRELHPGDRVRFKLRRGTAEGTVVVSKRTLEVLPDGRKARALAIDWDGTTYDLHEGGVTKLS